MGFPMPYQLEKGPIWSVVESALRRDPPTAYMLLEYLRDRSKPLSLGPIVSSKTLDKGPLTTAHARGQHLDEDWFGMVQDATGAWQKQPDSAWDPVTKPSLGFWINYWGDVEAIVRETFTRAVEVALGLAHDETMTQDELEHLQAPRRFWPISVFLKCPTPWFEGWVTWRQWGRGRYAGEVVVHFNTPGHVGSQVLNVPATGLNEAPVVDPTDCSAANGMWLISSARHTFVPPPPTSTPSTGGQWTLPSLGVPVKDDPRLVVLQTAEADGGVAPNGRAYQV